MRAAPAFDSALRVDRNTHRDRLNLRDLHRAPLYNRTYAVAHFEPDFACGSTALDHVCLSFLRSPSAKMTNGKRGKYHSAEDKPPTA
jgi:hypothetical protein